MRLWRLTRAIHLDAPLSGLGAKKHGGRWSSKGHPVVYTSESLELALLEALAHLDGDQIPRDMHQVCIELDDSLGTPLAASLPDGWDRRPPDHLLYWTGQSSVVDLNFPHTAPIKPSRTADGLIYDDTRRPGVAAPRRRRARALIDRCAAGQRRSGPDPTCLRARVP